MNGDVGVNGSWQNYKCSQSQFILLTIRSNLFHANSSLRFQKVLFDINRSGCSCHNPLSAALCFDYTQLTALYSTCNGLLSPALTAKLNGFEICLYRRCMLDRTRDFGSASWITYLRSVRVFLLINQISLCLIVRPQIIRFTTVIILTLYKAAEIYVSFLNNLLTPAMKSEKRWRLFSENVLGSGTMGNSSQWLSHSL